MSQFCLILSIFQFNHYFLVVLIIHFLFKNYSKPAKSAFFVQWRAGRRCNSFCEKYHLTLLFAWMLLVSQKIDDAVLFWQYFLLHNTLLMFYFLNCFCEFFKINFNCSASKRKWISFIILCINFLWNANFWAMIWCGLTAKNTIFRKIYENSIIM